MTLKDKLEIGLKEYAPFRRDNLPDAEKTPDGPATRPDDPTRSPEEPGARAAAAKEASKKKLPPAPPKPCD
jgi:hypothetical protein